MANMWMVRAGSNGIYIDDFKQYGIVAIGFGALGDLSNLNPEQIKQRVIDSYPDYNNSQIGIQSGQVTKFVHEFQINDYVISYNSKRDFYLIGRITSDYYYSKELSEKNNDFKFNNFRNVEWLGEVKKFNLSENTRKSLRSAITIFKIYDDAQREFLNELNNFRSHDDRIDWTDFYIEFADKLLQFKDNKSLLIDKIQNVYSSLNLKLPSLERNEHGEIIVPYDIDPFTVFALFNKQLTDENRINIISKIKEEFSIQSPAPNDFYGIPVVNNMSATFYYFSDGRGEDDIDNLWSIFESAIEFSNVENSQNRENFVKYYNQVISQKGVKWNITMGLFWIRPNNYVNLDSHNRNILSNEEIFSDEFKDTIKSLKSPPSGDEYLRICKNVDLAIKNTDKYSSFADFSHNAYCLDKLESESKRTGIGDEDVETSHYWIYSPGEGAYKWEEFYKEGIMAIGWNETGNLRQYHKKNMIRSKLQEIYNDNSSHKNDVHALWQFANEIQVGDIIFAKKGMGEIIGKGIVESDYEYDTNYDYHHIRRVNWTHKGNWPYEDGKLAMKTITDITNYKELVNNIEEMFDDGYELPQQIFPKYDILNFLEEVYINEDDYNTLVNLLINKKNLIVEGAPGVGKTFLAKRLAYSMMGEKNTERVMMVQFHQSYSYEDFVMGYRPSKDGFELKRGSFYEFCKKAEEDSENPYFFIIDEINRGNLSKIFGELFMLIENDKRGEKNRIRLVYSNEFFYIPKNVYIIGLMNTADRSLAMIDYALRRRFAFFELKPGFDSDGFKGYQEELSDEAFDNLIYVMKELNEDIKQDESLGEGFRIGHSYLCNIKPEEVEDKLNYIVEYELIPLLKEYWFDEAEKITYWSDRLRRVIND